MKVFLVATTLLVTSTAYSSGECQKKLDGFAQSKVEEFALNPHIARLAVSAANRIMGSTFWTQAPQTYKIKEDLYRALFKSKGKSLELYFNSHAEVQGYIKDKVHWCMKDK